MSDNQRPIILLVDDSTKNLQILGNLLEVNFNTAAVTSGVEALEFLEKKRPDLILLDIMMPKMDGYALCRMLKEKEETREIPVIFLTAKADSDSIVKGFKCGAADYIQKPFNPPELLARVQTQLKLKKSKEEIQAVNKDLLLSKNKLDTVFKSIPEGIIAVDRQLRVIQQNETLSRICPFIRELKPHQPLTESSPSCTGECFKILSHSLKSQKPVKEYHMKCMSKTGRQKNLVLNSSLLFGEEYHVEGALLVIRDVTHIRELEDRLQEQYSFKNMIGKNKKIQAVHTLVEQLADVDTTVLITGESGTGKELVVEALHHGSFRSKGPLVRINCSVLPESILESELFGHVKGSFTGAIKDRTGRIQSADGGTLFLDEIGDLSPLIQLKLLRFLERKEYERVGDNRTLTADVKIIAATHTNLVEQVNQGSFRQDFYYRLKVMTIDLPPLRERLDDIPLLIEHFCRMYSKSFNKQITDVSDEVLACFRHYDWPGNIREMKHILERAFILCSEKIITAEYLPPEMINPSERSLNPRNLSHKDTVTADDIRKTLKKTEGNKAQTARLLGIHRSTLYRKLDEL